MKDWNFHGARFVHMLLHYGLGGTFLRKREKVVEKRSSIQVGGMMLGIFLQRRAYGRLKSFRITL